MGRRFQYGNTARVFMNDTRQILTALKMSAATSFAIPIRLGSMGLIGLIGNFTQAGHRGKSGHVCSRLKARVFTIVGLALAATLVFAPPPADAAGGYENYGYGRPYHRLNSKGIRNASFPHGRFRRAGFRNGGVYRKSFYRGGFRRRAFYRRGFYRPGFRPGFRYGFSYGPFYGGRFYGYPRYFFGGGFRGNAALAAAGIVGGVVLIDRVLEREWEARQARYYADARARELARQRFYESRGYRFFRGDEFDDQPFQREQFRRRDESGRDGQSFNREERGRLEERESDLDRDFRTLEVERRALEAERRAFERERREFERRNAGRGDVERRDFEGNTRRPNADQLEQERSFEDQEEILEGLDEQLLGVETSRRSVSIEENRLAAAAFNACAGATREAARSSGFMVALPNTPALADVDGEGTYRLEASFTAENGQGNQYQRTMRCAADGDGIAYLEII